MTNAADDMLRLADLGRGAAEEMFAESLQRILANIDDPNTEAKAKRTFELKAVFHPNKDRSVAEVEISIREKLAGRLSHTSTVHIGLDKKTGRYVATANDPNQGRLFEATGGVPLIHDVDEKGKPQ